MRLGVDTSALVAIITEEPEAALFIDLLAAANTREISTVNVLEARLVVTFTKNLPAETVDDLLRREAIDIVPFDASLFNLAFEAYRRYGKGRHPAKLNMGDCASYALAKARGCPLLYPSGDLAQTDIERA